MARHHLPKVWLTEEHCLAGPQAGRKFGITIEPNQDASCFSLRETHANGDEDDLIHFCDWRELVKEITRFMEDRERIAREDGDWLA